MRPLALTLLALSVAGLGGGGARAADEAAPAGHPFVCADYSAGRICIVSREGKVEWDCPAPGCTDVWVLPSGNILFTHSKGAREVTRDKKVVWEYDTAPENEVYTCQRLPNGDTLVGELGPCRIVEVGPDGQVRKTVKVPTQAPTHAQFRHIRKLPNGHYLVPCMAESVVKELDADGAVVWSAKVVGNPFCAIRLPNGNTLVGCGDGHALLELDREGKTIWQIGENDLRALPLRFVAGVQRLPNGNTVVCNWLGHGYIGNGTLIFEVTPDKKVVWKVEDHQTFKAVAAIQLLDTPGDVAKGGIVR